MWARLALLPALLDVAVAANIYVSHYSGNIHTLTLTGSGTSYTLGLNQTLKIGGQPTWMTYNSTTRMMYVSDETSYGSASLWAIQTKENGGLTLSAKATAKPGAVAHSLYGDDKFLAIAHYGTSMVSTFKLPLTSSSQTMQTIQLTMNGKGTNPSRQDAPHPHEILVDTTGKYILAFDLGADLIRIYSIDFTTGALTACPSFVEVGGTGPRHGTFYTPSILYVANELANSVHSFAVTYPSGGCLTLTKTQSLTTMPGGRNAPSGTKVAEVHTAGQFLYAANRRDLSFSPSDSMAAFSLSSTGSMTFMNITSSGGTYPRTFSINKAGDLVVIGDQTTANVVVVKRDTTTGALGPQVASLRIDSTGTAENDDGLSDVLWDE